MAKAFINDENLTDIADAIRATLDESRQYLPSEMAAAIDSIPIMAQLNRKKYFQSVPAGAASGYATIEQIEGNTVAWNQLVDTGDTSCTVPNGHVYYANISGTSSIATSDGNAFAVTGGTDNVCDLTAIFGAGNEPRTVAEFEAWMAQNIGSASYYDYNAGELISCKMSGMQTEDSSQQVVDTIALDVTTITGINTATNVRETIFPQGMKQADRAGTVKDELDILSGTATVRVTSLDMGSLSWSIRNYSGRPWFIAEVLTLELSNSRTSYLQPRYKEVTNSATAEDKVIHVAKYIATTSGIYIRDTNYTDAATFKAAMNGVMLNYVLATPITYTDLQDANGNPLNPRYKVEQGGTEQVLPVNTSTPTTVAPTLTTVYTKENN